MKKKTFKPHRAKPNKLIALISVGTVVLVGVYLLLRSFALTGAPGRFYLTPSSGNQTTDFSVQVKLDTAALSVNSLETKISYPADKLDFVGNDDTGSVFTSPFPGNGVASNGIITISKGDPNGRSGTGLLVSTLKFRPKAGATGAAALSYTFGEALEVGSGANIVGTRDGASYTVGTVTPPPTALGRFYINPATATETDSFSIQVKLNTAGDAVNSLEAKISYPVDKLDFVSNSETGSAFTSPFPGNGVATNGVVTISKGNPTAQNGDLLVATLNFKVHAGATGAAPLSFTFGEALKAVGGTNIVGTRDGASYTVQATAPVDYPPKIAAFTATPSNAVIGTGIALAANATDDKSVSKVEFSRNGTVFATDVAPPYTATLNTAGLTPGSYPVTAKVTDSAGQTAESVVTITLTPTTSGPIIGDLNNDGIVDEIDLSIMFSHWKGN